MNKSLEEMTLLNYWINSGEITFLSENGLEVSDFIDFRNMADFIVDYTIDHRELPNYGVLDHQFKEEFVRLDLADAMSSDAAGYGLKEVRARIEFRRLITGVSQDFSKNKETSFELLEKMKLGTEETLDKFRPLADEAIYDYIDESGSRYVETTRKMALSEERGGITGLRTGFGTLDNAIGGIQDEEFLLMSARVNMGKSLVAAHIGYYAWQSLKEYSTDKSVLFVSTEMPSRDVAYRLDTLALHVSNKSIRRGSMLEPQDLATYRTKLKEQRVANSGNERFKIVSSVDIGLKTRPSDVARLIKKYNAGLVIIDQLYDIQPEDERPNMSTRERINSVTKSLFDIGLREHIPFIVIAQTKREFAYATKKAKNVFNHTPGLEDIQESDYPGQKATTFVSINKVDATRFVFNLGKARNDERDVKVYVEADIDSGHWKEREYDEMGFSGGDSG